MELESGLISLSTKDLSGGVFEPVFWNEKIVYVGEFYRQNRLLIMTEAAGGKTAAVVDVVGAGAESELPVPSRESLYESSHLPSKEYFCLSVFTMQIFLI